MSDVPVSVSPSGAPPATSVAFELLGPVRVLVDGAAVEVGGSGPLSVLAVLLLSANRVVPVEELVEAIWGDEEPPSARRMVRMYAGRIRRALDLGQEGVPALVAEGSGFRLAVVPESVDATRFEALLDEAGRVRVDDPERALDLYREALALWRGPALAGLALGARGRRLEELRIAALEGSVEARLALGEHAGAIGDLEGLIDEHPHRERLHVLLMTALYRAGRQTDALAHCKELRRRLVHDLGVEPGAEVRELERAILRHDPSLGAPVRARAPRPALDARPVATTPPRSRRRLLVVAGAVVLAVALGLAALLRGGGAELGPSSVGVLDASSGKLLHHVSVGGEPTSVLFLGGARALVATRRDRSVALVDLDRGRVVGRFGTGIAGGHLIRYQAILHRTAVLNDPDSMKYTILDLDVHRRAGLTGRLIQMPVHVPFGADGVDDIVRVPKSGAYLTADGWLVAVGSELHYEWGPQGRWKVADTSGPLAYAQGVVWLAPRGTRELVGFGVDIEKVARRIPLPAPARALAASGDDLWVLPADRSTILHFKASASFQLSHADIPGTVTALRADAGGLWVGTDGGLLLRVPAAGRSVAKTVARLHHPVAAIALERGRVVVAVR